MPFLMVTAEAIILANASAISSTDGREVLGTKQPSATNSHWTLCLYNTAVEARAPAKSWMSGESKTDRQSKSAAIWYVTGIEMVNAGVDIISTRLQGCPKPEPELMVQGLVPGSRLTDLLHATCRKRYGTGLYSF